MASSPPISRAVAVLNFLGGHAGQAFTLTEIAKSLRISSATCHNLLGALAEAGYIYRTAAKTYVIGPGVSRVAQAAVNPDLLMQVVRPEMRAIADEFDVVCSVYTLRGDQIVVRERAAALSHVAWNMPGRASLRATAPVGTLFVAWDELSDLETWFSAANPPLNPTDRDDLHAAMGFLRERGYAFGVRTASIDGLERALELHNRRDMTDYALSSLDPKASYNLAFVASPVFGAAQKVVFGLGLVGFDKPLKGDAVEAMGTKLRAACTRITRFIAGRDFPPL
ncbi:DNA-binding IclR family transcriptional regulator [Sphingobium sp. OAS761]|uniref:IclR family transcriptional regulator n=1 Tax=Sphingobium sp. OAS761 TaxID=2817901 RepID=UPI00209FC716|nr:helix-turn-helix domain-containing protein [Sphingobium sp. OAS761]MCP1470346.1 DNA-binding IclR family transcriptional regulator [Sphingobium sp. OAS761]